MKRIPYTKTLIAALLFIPSCGKTPTPSQTSPARSIKQPFDCGIKIEELTTCLPPTKNEVPMLYIVNLNGARQFEKPDTNSIVLGKYQYADNIWPDRLVDTIIKGKKSSWYIIDENVTKTKRIDNADYSARVSSTVFVQKKDVGAESKIMMTPNDVYEILDDNHFPSQKSKKYISIQSLGHHQFYKEPIANHWIRTSYYWAYNAVVDKIELKLNKTDTLLKFTNLPYQDEADRHVYLEDIRRLNCHMIFGAYYEDHRFILYDKGTGEKKANLMGYPCISPKNKYIVSVFDNPYGEYGGQLQIHSITRTGPYKLLHSFKFINWHPYEDPMEFVWINDREFKMKVYSYDKHFRKWVGKEFEPRTGYLKFRIL